MGRSSARIQAEDPGQQEADVPTQTTEAAQRRAPLSRERVLETALKLADEGGLESLTMRRLGQELGVELLTLGQSEAAPERTDHVVLAAADRQVGEAIALRFPVGVGADAAEVEEAQAAVGPEQVVTRVRVGV